MPKMKTNKATKKRFKVTGSGKLMRKQAFHNHLLRNKSKKQKERLSKFVELDNSLRRRINKLLARGR